MFTGLVEEIGSVIAVNRQGKSLKIKIGCKKAVNGAKVGDSIATNGVCLTAVEVGSDYFMADAMPETYERSNLKRLKTGDRVNLEKSITLSTPLGGHLVTGDVDCEGTIVSKIGNENAIIYEIEMNERFMKYIVEKGRVTIDGASLTVMDFSDERNSFKVSLIPHTQNHITLGGKGSGDIVNIETDIVGKYIERFTKKESNTEPVKKSIDMKFLADNGFM